MPQSLSQLYVHIVFSTKHRLPFLSDNEFSSKVHAYLAGICHNLNSPSIIVGGATDHVHILCNLSREITIKDLLRDLKRYSSRWIKQTFDGMRRFYWQSGYGAFSISPSHVAPLKRYILNQEKHHKKESFQDEFRRLLKKYNVEYDERYVWD